MGNYTVYVNPYLVLRSGGYTKHYYIEGQRIVSKLGSGLNNKGKGPLKAGSEKVNYSKKQQDSREGIVKNLKWLGQDGQLLTAGNSGKTPPGQLKKIKGGDGSGDGKGKDKGGKDKDAEKFQYYYHPDHLGSTSYITDASGEVYQHLEYFAFGETFVEEHSNRKHTPYKFNGKELDEETGLYYYGARYYDARTSVWLAVDRFAEKYPGVSPYVYVNNNPLLFTDPTGDTLRFASNVSEEFKGKIQQDINQIRKTKYGAKVLNRLEKSELVYEIAETDNLIDSKFQRNEPGENVVPSGGLLRVSTDNKKLDGVNFKSLYTLGHELGHAYQKDRGLIDVMGGMMSANGKVNMAELQAVGFENYLRASFNEKGFNTPRLMYSGFQLKEYHQTVGFPSVGLGVPRGFSLGTFKNKSHVWRSISTVSFMNHYNVDGFSGGGSSKYEF